MSPRRRSCEMSGETAAGMTLNDWSQSNCAENDPQALHQRIAQLESKSVDQHTQRIGVAAQDRI